VPKQGDKKTLLELSMMNCKQYKFDRLKQAEKLNPEQKQVRLMKELQEKLGLPKMPYHIECFDNSNISGSDAVAACVVFKKMKPSKRDYKHYNIKTVVGPDDYASMKEVIYRRYYRNLMEQREMADLIIVDGGIGQINAAKEIIDSLHVPVHLAGLAKDDKHSTAMLIDREGNEVPIDPKSQLFFLLTRMQDEVHRYAISFHRQVRSKSLFASILDEVEGIGEVRKRKLLNKFKSVKKMKEASVEELTEVLPQKVAQELYQVLHRED
jgi:excinuclease ABC subunit C